MRKHGKFHLVRHLVELIGSSLTGDREILQHYRGQSPHKWAIYDPTCHELLQVCCQIEEMLVKGAKNRGYSQKGNIELNSSAIVFLNCHILRGLISDVCHLTAGYASLVFLFGCELK